MIWIILILGLMALFFFYKKSKKNNFDNRLKKNNTLLEEQKSNTYFNLLLNQYINKINLKYDHPIFSHNNIRLKCIRAGIRDPKKQKLIILLRYLLIIPGGIAGIILGNMVAEKINFISDEKLLLITAILGGIVGYFLPVTRLDSRIQDMQLEIKKAFPDFLDIMLVCVGAGMTAEQAYIKISKDMNKFSKVMSEEVEILSFELTYFLEPKIAYENFYQRTQNEYVRAYVAIVLQSIYYGTPLSSGLRSLSLEVREKEMGDIEKKAASLPSKLTVPMMIFTLPVLFVVIGYPAAMQVMAKF